jgi:hypothetical protein
MKASHQAPCPASVTDRQAKTPGPAPMTGLAFVVVRAGYALTRAQVFQDNTLLA